jgi:hypothetical protein
LRQELGGDSTVSTGLDHKLWLKRTADPDQKLFSTNLSVENPSQPPGLLRLKENSPKGFKNKYPMPVLQWRFFLVAHYGIRGFGAIRC